MVNPEFFPLDPALEELLHEVARDPRSCLLRVERPARPAKLTDSWEALSRWSPGLTVAEREILDVHRAELATLLLHRWAAEIELRPPPRLFLARSSTAKKPAPPIDLEALRERSERLRAEGQPNGGDPDLTPLLESARPLSSEQMSAMVTTAVRLHPTSAARIHQALDLVRTDQPRTAIGVLRRLLQVESRPEMRSYCWNNLALAHGDEWNPTMLIEYYRRACDIDQPRMDVVAAWLLFATQFGCVDSARQAAEMLDSLFDPEDPAIDRHVQQQVRTRQEGRWTPRPVVKSVLDDLLAGVGPTARKVLNALTPDT